MQNPNIGFKVVSLLMGFYDLDHSIRCNSPEKAMTAISEMINTLRKLRRAIRLDVNTMAWIKGKGGKDNEIKSN
jgi:hypothetical protein